MCIYALQRNCINWIHFMYMCCSVACVSNFAIFRLRLFGTCTGTKSVSQSVSQSVIQPASQSVIQPVSQSTSQSVSQSVIQPDSQSTSQSVSHPASQSVSQPASQSVSLPAFLPLTQSVTKPSVGFVWNSLQDFFYKKIVTRVSFVKISPVTGIICVKDLTKI